MVVDILLHCHRAGRSDLMQQQGKHHNTRTTTWNHQCPDKPWKRFDMAFDELKRSTTLSPLSPLANLFLLAGDIHATLYTGSKAMHNKFFPMK
ncbi:hypothetical protein NC651_040391 [Populus alba x Populus x berolinensis]|nr:hypothetical protein NC651_040391 [Populus alba x Populus x berolinensis]